MQGNLEYHNSFENRMDTNFDIEKYGENVKQGSNVI